MDQLKIFYEQIEDGWWMAMCAEFPEAKTQGETLEEARENIKEAVLMVIETRRELADRDFPHDDRHRRESLQLAF